MIGNAKAGLGMTEASFRYKRVAYIRFERCAML